MAEGVTPGVGLPGIAGIGIAEGLLGGADALNNIVSTLENLSRNPLVAGFALERLGGHFQRNVVDNLVKINKLTGESEKKFRAQAEAMIEVNKAGLRMYGVIGSLILRLADLRQEQERLAATTTKSMGVDALRNGYEGRLKFAKEYMHKEAILQAEYGKEMSRSYMQAFELMNRRMSNKGALPDISGQSTQQTQDNTLKVISAMALLLGRNTAKEITDISDANKSSGASIGNVTDAYVELFNLFSKDNSLEDASSLFGFLSDQIKTLGEQGVKIPEIFRRVYTGIAAGTQAGLGVEEQIKVARFADKFAGTNFDASDEMYAAARAAGLPEAQGDWKSFGSKLSQMETPEIMALMQKIVQKQFTSEELVKIQKKGGRGIKEMTSTGEGFEKFRMIQTMMESLLGKDLPLAELLQAGNIPTKVNAPGFNTTGTTAAGGVVKALGQDTEDAVNGLGETLSKLGGYVKSATLYISDAVGATTKFFGITKTAQGPGEDVLTGVGYTVGGIGLLSVLKKIKQQGVAKIWSRVMGGEGAATGATGEYFGFGNVVKEEKPIAEAASKAFKMGGAASKWAPRLARGAFWLSAAYDAIQVTDQLLYGKDKDNTEAAAKLAAKLAMNTSLYAIPGTFGLVGLANTALDVATGYSLGGMLTEGKGSGRRYGKGSAFSAPSDATSIYSSNFNNTLLPMSSNLNHFGTPTLLQGAELNQNNLAQIEAQKVAEDTPQIETTANVNINVLVNGEQIDNINASSKNGELVSALVDLRKAQNGGSSR